MHTAHVCRRAPWRVAIEVAGTDGKSRQNAENRTAVSDNGTVEPLRAPDGLRNRFWHPFARIDAADNLAAAGFDARKAGASPRCGTGQLRGGQSASIFASIFAAGFATGFATIYATTLATSFAAGFATGIATVAATSPDAILAFIVATVGECWSVDRAVLSPLGLATILATGLATILATGFATSFATVDKRWRGAGAGTHSAARWNQQ